MWHLTNNPSGWIQFPFKLFWWKGKLLRVAALAAELWWTSIICRFTKVHSVFCAFHAFRWKNTLTILFFWFNVLKITFTILGNKNQSLLITDYWCFINHWSYSCLWGKVNDNDDDDLGSLQRVLNVGEALAAPTPAVRHLGTRRWQPWQLMSIWSWHFNNILSICQFNHDTININNWKWLFSDWE